METVNNAQEKVANVSITESDWEQWLGNWIWRAVQCLVEAPNFNPSPKFLSKKLRISVEQAIDALDGLERLGCIEKDMHSYKTVEAWMQLTPQKLERSKLLSAQSRIAPQLISKLTEQDAFTSQFFLGNKEIVFKYAPKFMELFRQMNDEGLNQKQTDVVAAQISFVQLTSEQEAGAIQ